MITPNTTIAQLVSICHHYGTGTLKFVPKDKDGVPVAAVIVVDGREPTREILDAIEPIENLWASAWREVSEDCVLCQHDCSNSSLEPCSSCLTGVTSGFEPK